MITAILIVIQILFLIKAWWYHMNDRSTRGLFLVVFSYVLCEALNGAAFEITRLVLRFNGVK